MFVCFVTGKNYKPFSVSAILWALIIAYGIMAFLWQPAWNEDLVRYFQQANEIRSSGLSLFDFVTQSIRGIKDPIGGYGTLYTFNFIRYIIHYIFENNHWLPCIFTMIHYAIWHYITLDWFKRHNFDHKWLMLVMITASPMAPLFFVASGVRNGLAAAVTALAIYLRIYRRKSLTLYLVISFFAATIHPGVLSSIGLGLVYPYLRGSFSMIAALSASFMASRILKALSGSSIAYISFISDHFSNYYVNAYYDFLVPYYSDIALVILMLCLFLIREVSLSESSSYDKPEKDMNHFIIVYLVVSLCACFIGIGDVLFRRMLYVLSPLSGILVSFLAENKHKQRLSLGIMIILTTMFAVFCLSSIAYDDGMRFFKRVLYLFLKV